MTNIEHFENMDDATAVWKSLTSNSRLWLSHIFNGDSARQISYGAWTQLFGAGLVTGYQGETLSITECGFDAVLARNL